MVDFFWPKGIETATKLVEYVRTRMERILGELNGVPQNKNKSIRNLFINQVIIAMRDDREQLLMRLSDGDKVQYDSLKKANVREFLNKFAIFVDELKVPK